MERRVSPLPYQAGVEKSARQLAALVQLGQAAASSLDQAVVLDRVLAEAKLLLAADSVAILLVEADQISLAAVGGAEAAALVGQRMPSGAGLAGQVLQTSAPVLAYAADQLAALHPPLEQFGSAPARVLLAAPLHWQGQVIGVLEALYTTPPATRPGEAELLTAAASWAAIAIGNARQHARIQRRLQESEAMSVISQALNETHNLDQILQMIVDAARQIIPRVQRAVIHLLDADAQALRPAAFSSLERLTRSELSMRPGEGIAGRVMAEGVSINVADILTDPRYLPSSRIPNLRSLLVAPVQSGDRRLGTISVQSVERYAFSTDDEQLLKTLGLQAALAIENARLLSAESAARRDAESLGDIGKILSSTLVFEQILDRLLEQIGRLVPYDAALLLLVDPKTGRARTARLRGYDRFGPELVQAVRGLSLEVAALPRLRHMAQTGQPLAVPDVRADPHWLPREIAAPARSWLGAPILIQSEGAVAFFSLDKLEPGFYRAEHAQKLVGFIGQASLAIQNARLYADLEKSLRYEKSMRARLVQTEKLAAMGRLVASVAHELNNPLQAIQNSLYLVKQEAALGPQSREDLQVALTEADRMAELISRLRETYRPASAEQFRPEMVNVLIEDVQRLIATHLRHSQVRFVFEPAAGLPPVPGIRDQLKQVLLNLSLNAVEAMPAGGQLTVQTRHLPEQGEVLVTVSDTGAGIDPADLPSIFEPFFTKKEGGTGLGLFITHEIIQRHLGRVEVDSRLGQGSTFRVWLPVVRAEVAGSADPAA
ncbi:MAG: GAF domain-containing protein [Anaerolineales bacterium]|nr:GAF domain-containing protein [Anaerolineales bacterium]